MSGQTSLEKGIRDRGAIKIEPFTTRAGAKANCKVVVDNEFLKKDLVFAQELAKDLAGQMEVYKPRVIIPVPTGANLLGELVAKELGISLLCMNKHEDGGFCFSCRGDAEYAAGLENIGFVDDVYTTGGAFHDISSIRQFEGKAVVGGVIWDRSDSAIPKKADFLIVSVIRRYVPLRVADPS